jgi:hypothetical protein
MSYKFTKEEVLGNQEYIPPVTYKFWNKKEQKMYDVKEISYNRSRTPVNIIVYTEELKTDTALMGHGDGELIPSTNIVCKNKQELFAGDIVVCNFLPHKDKIRVVYWDNGWRVFGVSTEDFEANAHDMVFCIGHKHIQTKTYEHYVEQIVNKLQK